MQAFNDPYFFIAELIKNVQRKTTMQDSKFLKQLKKSFHFLFAQFSYRITNHDRYESFGNESVNLHSNSLWMIISRDRDQIFLEIAAPPGPKSPKVKRDNWFGLGTILQSINAANTKKILKMRMNRIYTTKEDFQKYNVKQYLKPPTDKDELDLLAQFLNHYYAEIVEIFSPKKKYNTHRKLNNIRRQTSKEWT